MDVHGGVIESDEWAGRNANPSILAVMEVRHRFSRYGFWVTAPKLRQQLQVKSPSGFGPQQGVSPLLFIVGSLRSSAKRFCSAARWLALVYSVKSIVNSSFCICASGTPYFDVTLYKVTVYFIPFTPIAVYTYISYMYNHRFQPAPAQRR